jgi:hypothetical protein
MLDFYGAVPIFVSEATHKNQAWDKAKTRLYCGVLP